MKNTVVFEISKKELKSLPDYILLKLRTWSKQVEELGLKKLEKQKDGMMNHLRATGKANARLD